MSKISARSLILLLILLSSLLPIIGLGYYSYEVAREEMVNEVYKQTDIALQNKSEQLNSYFFNALNETDFVSEVKEFKDLIEMNKVNSISTQYEKMKDESTRFLRKKVDSSEFSYAYVTDENGFVLVSTNTSKIPVGTNLSTNGYIKNALKGETHYSNIFLSKITGIASLVASTPIYDETGRNIIGSMNFLIESTGIDDVVHRNLEILGTSGNAYLVDINGVLMSNSRLGEEDELLVKTVNTLTTQVLSEEIINENTEFIYHGNVQNESGESIMSSATITKLGDTTVGLIVEVSEEEALEALFDLRTTMFIVIAVIVLITFGLGIIISRSILKPIVLLTNKASIVAKGEVDVDLGHLSERFDEIGKLAVAFSDIIESNKLKAQMIDDIAHGNFSDLKVSDETQDVVFKNIKLMVHTLNQFSNHIEQTSSVINEGRFDKRVSSDGLMGRYEELSGNVNQLIEAFVSKIDTLGTPIYIVNKELELTYLNQAFEKLIRKDRNNLLNEKIYDVLNISSIDEENNSSKRVMTSRETETKDEELYVNGTKLHVQFVTVPITDEIGNLCGTFTSVTDQTELIKERQKLEEVSDYQQMNVEVLLQNLKKLSIGSFEMNFDEIPYNETTKEVYLIFKEINDNLQQSVLSIQSYVEEISEVLGELSNSNLDVSVEREYIGEFSDIKDALNKIVESFRAVVSRIHLTSNEVHQGATKMNESALDLSSGATEQAATIEEISATVTQVSAQVQDNLRLVDQVFDIAKVGEETAVHSNKQMSQMNHAMTEIHKSSENIKKVLKLINDIAFQTNILSLNAAVEAARAGQHGKGFAVIAEDVRNLALKSATAADQTSDMIEEIIDRINRGNSIASETTQSLKKILDGTQETSKLSEQVRHATSEQASAMGQIELSINQISEVVQSTSVNAQRGANISKQLTDEAKNLKDIISVFNIDQEHEQSTDFLIENQQTDEEEPVILLDDTLF